jgi:hypothetical protein
VTGLDGPGTTRVFDVFEDDNMQSTPRMYLLRFFVSSLHDPRGNRDVEHQLELKDIANNMNSLSRDFATDILLGIIQRVMVYDSKRSNILDDGSNQTNL